MIKYPKLRLFSGLTLMVLGTIFLAESCQLIYQYNWGEFSALTRAVLRDGGTVTINILGGDFSVPLVFMVGFLLGMNFYTWAVLITLPLTKQSQFRALAVYSSREKA